MKKLPRIIAGVIWSYKVIMPMDFVRKD